MKDTVKKVFRYFYLYLVLMILHTLLLTTPYVNIGNNVVNVLGTIYGIVIHGAILYLTARVIFKEVKHKIIKHALLIGFAFVYVRFFIESISSNIYFIN